MKRIFLLLILLCTHQAFSQRTEKGYFVLNGGLANPVGDFSDTGPDNEKAGFAGAGLNASLSYVAALGKNFGVGLIYGLRRNTPDFEEINDYMQKAGYGRPYASPDKYRSNYLMLEAVYSIPGSETTKFYGKLGGGVSFNTMPRIFTDKKTMANASVFPKLTADALVYGLTGGIRFQPSAVGFGAEVSYINTEPTFEGNGINFDVPMNTLNYNLNLFFQMK